MQETEKLLQEEKAEAKSLLTKVTEALSSSDQAKRFLNSQVEKLTQDEKPRNLSPFEKRLITYQNNSI